MSLSALGSSTGTARASTDAPGLAALAATENVAVLNLCEVEPRQPGVYERFFKRAVDVVFALAGLLLLAPLMALIALTVRLSMGPNIYFHQERVGRNGRPFRMVKFRSMRPDRRLEVAGYDGEDRRRTHKSTADPRHTPIGRFLRKWSLDELPQLFNILRGDMSLVGPRPELLTVARRHGLVDHPRNQVRPGLTGLWQVSPARSALLHEDTSLDMQYVARVTLLGDLRILLQTIPAVLRARGR